MTFWLPVFSSAGKGPARWPARQKIYTRGALSCRGWGVKWSEGHGPALGGAKLLSCLKRNSF